ncbi:MAG: hypothetical protein UV79_C0004G0013 [candidate division TM6 bacterium GW2011_GWF2_43_17]|nr:MAG: hypothetical protein UV79_C0004G0013 [candidate division TM6 bacterium GW2011_GWF2_43_17]
MKIVLASSSKTRQRLLDEAHIPYILTTHAFDERSIDDNATAPAEFAQFLAEQKAAHAILPATTRQESKTLVIGADTIVYCADGRIFHKPQSYDEAVHMLIQYNQSTVLVTTGLAGIIYNHANAKKQLIVSSQTTTKFQLSLSPDFIVQYLDVYQNDYQHVAGGLIIEGFGAQCVVSIEGSYTSALGLPMEKIRKLITQCLNIRSTTDE